MKPNKTAQQTRITYAQAKESTECREQKKYHHQLALTHTLLHTQTHIIQILS